MEYVLLIILVLQLLIAIAIVKDIVHPIVMLRIAWILSTAILLIYKDVWDVSLSGFTVFIFLMGFAFFDLGYYFYRIITPCEKINIVFNKPQLRKEVSLNKSFFVLMIFFAFSFYICYLSIQVVGSFQGLSNFLIDLRYLMKRTEINTSLIQFGIRIIESLGVVYILIYLIDNHKSKTKRIVYLSIIILSLLMMVLSTGRYRFLAVLVMGIYLYIINERKKGNAISLKGQIKLVRIGILSVLAFGLFFSTFGSTLLGKGQTNPFDHLAIYLAGGLVAFDTTWESVSNSSPYFGAVLFSPMFSLLGNLFHINFIKDSTGVLSTVYAENGFATNVFTFYYQQIIDFGVIAIPFVMFFLGLMFAFLNKKSISEEKIGFWSVLYVYFLFGIINSPFQDTFFTNTTYTYLSIITFFIMLKTKLIFRNKSKMN